MKNNYVYIPIFSLIYNCVKHSNTFSVDSNLNKYSLYLFLKSDSKQNYVFKGCFSLFLNLYSDDVFELDCKNGTEFKFFIKQDDRKNNSDAFFNTFERQAISNLIEAMKTLKSKEFICFDGKIENGEPTSLICGPERVKFYKQYIDVSNAKNKNKEQIWDNLLSKKEKQNEIEDINGKYASINDKIKIAKNQIQKENKPMSQNNFTNYGKQ